MLVKVNKPRENWGPANVEDMGSRYDVPKSLQPTLEMSFEGHNGLKVSFEQDTVKTVFVDSDMKTPGDFTICAIENEYTNMTKVGEDNNGFLKEHF